MWSRVEGYLRDLGMHISAHDDFIPENIFYRLAMKAKNETAKKFQAKVADEIIPSIRRNGMYATDKVIDKILDNPDFGIELLTKLKEIFAKNLAQGRPTQSNDGNPALVHTHQENERGRCIAEEGRANRRKTIHSTATWQQLALLQNCCQG